MYPKSILSHQLLPFVIGILLICLWIPRLGHAHVQTNSHALVNEQALNFQVVDNFEGLTNGELDDQNGWTASDRGNYSVVPDPQNSSNQVMEVDGTSIHAYKSLPVTIGNGATGTLHYRFRRADRIDGFGGMSDGSAPTSFSDFEVQFGAQDGINGPNRPDRFTVRDGSGFAESEEPFSTNVWYCVWLVANNQNDTFKVYLQGGGFAQITQLTASNKSVFGFRNGGNSSLRTFYTHNGNGTPGPYFFDDIYVDPSAENLSSPISSCQGGVTPTSTFTSTPVPPLTSTFTPTALQPTSTPTPTPESPTSTFTPTPMPVTPTFTPTPSVTETLAPGQYIHNGDFERGPNGQWIENSSNFGGTGSLILNQNVLPISPRGSYSAWLGGEDLEISDLSQSVDFPNLDSISLHFEYWIGSNDTCGNDSARVRLGTIDVIAFQLCSSTNTNDWTEIMVDVSSYAGQTETLTFHVETNATAISSFYIDNVALQAQNITPTFTPIPTFTDTPTVTDTPTPTDTTAPTHTPTDTAVPTATPTSIVPDTVTSTPSQTKTSTRTPSPTQTGTSMSTATLTPVPTSTPTSTDRPTNTPTPIVASQTATSTATHTLVPTSTSTPTPTPTDTSGQGGGTTQIYLSHIFKNASIPGSVTFTPTATPTIVPLPVWTPLGATTLSIKSIAIAGNLLAIADQTVVNGGIYQANLATCGTDPNFTIGVPPLIWSKPNRDDPQQRVQVYDIVFENSVGLAGTEEKVLIYENGIWTETDSEIENRVFAVAIGQNYFYAGSEGVGSDSSPQVGVFRRGKSSNDWERIRQEPKEIISMTSHNQSIWIGTARECVWHLNQSNNILEKRCNGLPNEDSKEIWDIKISPSENQIYVATSDGIYRGDGNTPWVQFGLAGESVRSLEFENDILYAGTDKGEVKFMNVSTRGEWQVASLVSNQPVHALLFDSANCDTVLAATDQGVWILR